MKLTIASKVTIARICLIPVFIVCYHLWGDLWSGAIPAAVFVLASMTDWVDGYLARSRNEVTNFGKFMDPIADKLLVMSAFVLLVGDGMSREALQKQAADLHAGDAVTFYGSVPATDVPRFTALADALLISLSDSPDLGLTVPGKLASYMAAAKPVLASMNGAGYAAVLESGGGLVSPAYDQKALADNMLALYRMTDAERAALGAKAKAYYTAHYRRAELLKRLEEFTVKGV